MSNRNPKVLLIDDDEAFCRYVAKHLERSGFEVVCKHTARDGIEAALNGAADAIILNHVLPERDGLSLLRSLTSSETCPPVIYLTANQDSRVAVAALKAGAADYVIKDLDGDFLLLLENAVTNALFAAAIKRDKEGAEAEVRAARDRFKALAEERALLLREINHRVSNSLQLISSLLHIQGEMSGNADVKAALNEANSRVLAVARVHRSLYTSFDEKWVCLSSYLSNLMQDLKDVTAGTDYEESAIAFSSDRIQAGPDSAVAVGIIAAELVLNSLRHAYPGSHGPVRVSLRAEASEVKLIVEDDGIGGMEGASRKSGLGQRIMGGMAEKLHGCLRYEGCRPGTRAIVTFPSGEDVRLAPNQSED